MDLSKVDLNAPAFGAGAQKVESISETTVVEPEKKPEVTPEPEPVKEPVVASEEETKVPYSRFKKFHDEAIRLRQEAEEWKAKAEAIKPVANNTTEDESLTLWKEMYGDSETSLKYYKAQQKQIETLKEQARIEALDAIRNERQEESQRTEKNIEMLDNQFEDLSAKVGRDLTEKEQSAILDIVDDYTPKDADGNYAGAILPFDKAWEIYELKNQAVKTPIAKSRDTVAALSGNKTQGESSNSDKDKDFNPLDWNAWKRRIT